MDSIKRELAYEFLPLVRVYKDGDVERLLDTDTIPATTNPQTSTSSKDLTIIPESDVSARLYLPKLPNPTQKFPLFVYFNGGAFCLSSPFTSKYHNYLTTVVTNVNVIAVFVNYRKAPEHPLPAAYEDSRVVL